MQIEDNDDDSLYCLIIQSLRAFGLVMSVPVDLRRECSQWHLNKTEKGGMKRRSYEEESQRGNETTVLRARGLRPLCHPLSKFRWHASKWRGAWHRDRQTDRQWCQRDWNSVLKKNRRISLDRASKRDNEGMTKLLPEKKGNGALDLKVRQKRWQQYEYKIQGT